MSKPKPGEWWVKGNHRAFICGHSSDGDLIWQDEPYGGFEHGTLDWSGWTHLPDCTGWDWEPETFPQYWESLVSKDYAFVRRDSTTRTVSVTKFGREVLWTNPWEDGESSYKRTRLTESEALALLDKPQQPAEDPEEWVVQGRVPARPIIDEERWLHRDGKVYIDWRKVYIGNTSNDMMHGQYDGKEKLELRCRRKDLPKPKRTVTLPKWLIVDDVGSMWICEQSDEPSGMTFIEVHRVGETTYEIQE